MRARLQIQIPTHRVACLAKLKDGLQAINETRVRERLANWVYAAQIGEAFRCLFPKQWQSACTSTTFVCGALSEREYELFRLLEEHFPVHELDGYEPDVSDDRPDGPPARICSHELNYSYEYACTSVVEVVLAYLASWNTDELRRYLTTEAKFPHDLPDHLATRLDRSRFVRRCAALQRKTGGAWRDLMPAIDLVSLSTGSPFTDAFTEDTYGFDQWLSDCGWSRQGLCMVKRAWACSEKYLDALARVVTWLEGEPEMWPHVFVVWRRCHASAEAEHELIHPEQSALETGHANMVGLQPMKLKEKTMMTTKTKQKINGGVTAKKKVAQRKSKQSKKIALPSLRDEAPAAAIAAAGQIKRAARVPPLVEPNGRIQTKREMLRLKALIGWTEDDQLLFKWRNPKGGTTTKFISPASAAAAFARTPILSPWLTPGLVRWGRTPQGDVHVYYFPPHVCMYRAIVDQVYQAVGGIHRHEDRIEFQVPMPAFLWATVGDAYRIFAMQGDTFDERGGLFVAPVPNTYSDGSICWGVNEKPRPGQVSPMEAWSLFWEAPFTGSVTQNKSQEYPDDVRQQMIALHGVAKYPDGDLIPARMTMEGLFEVEGRRSTWQD